MYNYHEIITSDIVAALEENNFNSSDYETRDEAFEALYDDFFISDSVTGNASGSYTINTYRAEENLVGNFGLLFEALDEFGYSGESLASLRDKGAEWADVTIRCYLLSECLDNVLNEYYN